MGGHHVTTIDGRSVLIGIKPSTWPRLGVIYYFSCLSSLCQHGHSNNSSYHYVSPTSSLTMAISMAGVVCCLRSPYRIPSSHIYRKFTCRQCSRVPAGFRKRIADVYFFSQGFSSRPLHVSRRLRSEAGASASAEVESSTLF